MNIRKTRKEDVPVIMDLYENAKAFMNGEELKNEVLS